MFYKVIIAQVGYIITLSKNNYMMQVDKILYRRLLY